MDLTTRHHFDNLHSKDAQLRYASFQYIINLTKQPVDWAYDVWDDMLALTKTGEQFALANTQLHYNMEGRDLVRSASLADYLKNPNFAHEKDHAPPKSLSLYPPVEYNGYAWGMAIDLGTCVGCNACVVACQSENNIPIVGKTEVMNGREMHWLRVDRYYEGPVEDPKVRFPPVRCMLC